MEVVDLVSDEEVKLPKKRRAPAIKMDIAKAKARVKIGLPSAKLQPSSMIQTMPHSAVELSDDEDLKDLGLSRMTMMTFGSSLKK